MPKNERLKIEQKINITKNANRKAKRRRAWSTRSLKLEFCFTSVGIFRFGADITQYKNILETCMNLLMSLEQNIMNLPTQIYSFPSKKTKLFRYFVIKELYFMGVNIIGLNFEDFKQLFHHLNHTVLINIIYQMNLIRHMYEFDEIGVQAWEAKGKIVTIIARAKTIIRQNLTTMNNITERNKKRYI